MLLRTLAAACWLILMAVAAGCGTAPAPASAPTPAAVQGTPPAAALPAPGAEAAAGAEVPAGRRIVFLGDSLTAGLGLSAEESYPALIQRRLDARQAGWRVVNAGVSGDTSAGGLRRLEWSMDGGAAIVVIALGGNDALRGLPVADLAANLDQAVGAASASGAQVIVVGMEAPPNTGPDYTAQFRAVYPEVARRHRATLVPFLLDGVAGIESLNQADGIHPNPAGARLVAETVWRALEPVVRELEAPTTR